MERIKKERRKINMEQREYIPLKCNTSSLATDLKFVTSYANSLLDRLYFY